MNSLGYAAVEKFGPENGMSWTKYIAWSGLAQLSRIISLDGCLCPPIIKERTEEDWKHVICENFMIGYYRDLDYLLHRIPSVDTHKIIGFVRQPVNNFPHGFNDPRFEFSGYDLMDQTTAISALVNCGGFPDCFQNSELNQSGLISTYQRAIEVQNILATTHPEESHAQCHIWALWVMREK